MTDSKAAQLRSRWLFGGTLLAALAIYLPLLAPSLVGHSTFIDTGVVLRFEPWSEGADPADLSGTTTAHDTVDSLLPRIHLVGDALRHGDIPTWDPYSVGGEPLGTLPSLGVLSPPGWPYLFLPLSYAPAVTRLLEVLCAIGFTYLFLRRLGLLPGPALLGGLLFSTSGFVVLWNNWPQAMAGSLLPALFWSVERALQERGGRAVAWVGLAFASNLLAGFPAVTVYGLYVLVPYVVVRSVGRRPVDLLRHWLNGAAGAGLGLGLAAVQLLPFVHFLKTVNLDYRRQAPGSHYPAFHLVTLVDPYAFGTETDLTYFAQANVVETCAYFGVVGVLLVLLAYVLRQRGPVPVPVLVYFTAAVAVLLLIGWISSGALGFAQHFPSIGNSNINRIRSVLGLLLAFLAAIGADALLRQDGYRKLVRWWVLPLVALLGWYGLHLGQVALRYARSLHHSHTLVTSARLPIVVGVLAVVVLVLALARGNLGRVALGLLPVLVAVESIAFIAPRWPSESKDQVYPVTDVHAFLAKSLGEQRFGMSRGTMFAGTPTYYRLRTVNGHAFPQPTWKDLVSSATPTIRQGGTLTLLGDDQATVTSPALDRLATSYFVNSIHLPVYGVVVAAPSVGTLRIDAEASVTVPLVPGPRRALVLSLKAPLETAGVGKDRPLIEATYKAGSTVVGQVRRRGLEGSRGALELPLPGDTGPLATATSVTLRFHRTAGVFAATAGGRLAVGEVRPQDDGLRVAFAGDAVVYQRMKALPRLRMVSRAVHQPDAAKALTALSTGAVPADTVLLDGPGADEALGGTTSVRLVKDTGERLRLSATSSAGGWVVVADALQEGWSVTVDGKRAALLHADLATVAVQVPKGTHDVQLSYDAPGFRAGKAVTGLSLLVLIALVGVSARRRTPPGPVPSEA